MGGWILEKAVALLFHLMTEMMVGFLAVAG